MKGVLCNWMVTFGAVLASVSRSTIGKIVAMWLPIATFFAHRLLLVEPVSATTSGTVANLTA